MRIDDPQIPPERIREFERAGYWVSTTSNEELDRAAASTPAKPALIDVRGRLTYAEYHRRVQRLAGHFVTLGLTASDVIAVQLPNWTEFAIAVNAAMMASVPFCQYHSDFRAREVEFILGFTKASLVIAPTEFRRFDYPAMIREMRPRLPALKHEMYVGDTIPPGAFDLRRFLDADAPVELSEAELLRRRPHGNDFMRTAFTSGTTGDPKAVLHLHNTTNCACRFLNEGQAITSDSVFLIFLPVGLNWGLFNVQQAIYAGCTAVLQDIFKAEQALALIQKEKVTHFCCAPAHLVSMLNVKDFDQYDLGSLKVMMTGGASCPIEVIREVRQRMPGHLLEMYGMLECGSQAHTRLDEDPEAVCGLVGRSLPAMRNKVVDDQGVECPPGTVGEILTSGPSVTIGYYNNPDANRRSFTKDGRFHTGDQGVFDEKGYLRIVGRTKEMIIRGGANIYPREIEEVLYQHPKVLDAAVVGLPDPRLGERTCACIVPKVEQTITLAELVEFLRPRIATYKMPEFLEVMTELPRTPTGKIQKGPLRDIVVGRRAAAGETRA
jgi:non-ribosomal peptide synthetase component E (peptide arylation enzyme)